MCYGLANTWPDCSSLQCRKFCLLLYPEGPKKVCLVSYSQCAKSVSICIQDIYDYKLQNATLPTIPVSNSCCAVGILYGWTLRSTGRIRREFVPASFTTRLTFGTAGHNYLTLSIACGLQDDFFFADKTMAKTVDILESVCSVQLWVGGGRGAFFNILKHQTHALNNPFALQLSLTLIHCSSPYTCHTCKSPARTLLITSIYLKGLGHVIVCHIVQLVR